MKNEVLDMKEELIEVLIRQRNSAHDEIAKLEAKVVMLNKKIEEYEMRDLMDDLFKNQGGV
jgi:Na+/phosphate symporter